MYKKCNKCFVSTFHWEQTVSSTGRNFYSKHLKKKKTKKKTRQHHSHNLDPAIALIWQKIFSTWSVFRCSRLEAEHFVLWCLSGRRGSSVVLCFQNEKFLRKFHIRRKKFWKFHVAQLWRFRDSLVSFSILRFFAACNLKDATDHRFCVENRGSLDEGDEL